MSEYERIRRQCVKRGELWEDTEFPTTQTSIFYHQSPPFQFVWKRPKVKKKTNKCRLICALPLDWWILEKEKKVNCESGRPNFHSPLCVVVAHSRPAIPCSVLFLKNAFPNPTSPFFYFIMTSLWLSIILRHLYSFGGCYFYDGSFKPPGRRKNNQNVFIYLFFFFLAMPEHLSPQFDS